MGARQIIDDYIFSHDYPVQDFWYNNRRLTWVGFQMSRRLDKVPIGKDIILGKGKYTDQDIEQIIDVLSKYEGVDCFYYAGCDHDHKPRFVMWVDEKTESMISLFPNAEKFIDKIRGK